ncbi:uncharacterized protein LOC111887594 [Lactuca sativa]|uniref:uncharacterized protein LOC111887594 n=1 Tax=Lactuca sativa TaxID=4236 RepID=UPI000CD7E9FD|nr:uncharacterized protein LOC111887594 [Lactuca sativa]
MLNMVAFRMMRLERDYDDLQPLPPPPVTVGESHSTHGSLEKLVVVLAVITIVGVIAGMIARLCGGRHYGGNGDHEMEGWIERRCKSCIDGGVSSAPPPPPPEETAKPEKEEAKKDQHEKK